MCATVFQRFSQTIVNRNFSAMTKLTKISVLEICKVKWGIRNGWSAARIALMLGLPYEAVCWAAAVDFSGPDVPIS